MNSCEECEHSNPVDYLYVCRPCLSNNRINFEEKQGDTMKIKIMLDDGAIVPTRAHVHDAGLDLYSREFALVKAGESRLFDTGVHVEIPPGYTGFIKSRSGMNSKDDITCEGVIDTGYTGSIKVNLRNHRDYEDYAVSEGQKIAQLVILPIELPELVLVEEFETTERGDNGFGSTGV